MSKTKKKCIICGASYSFPWQLMKHFEIHKNPDGQPHLCPECKLPFSTNWSFLIHLSHVHCDYNTRVYKCSKCDMRFKLESARSKHEKRKHGSKKWERRTDADPTKTANVQLEQQRKDDCLYASKRFASPLECSITTTTGTYQQSDYQTVESVNSTVPFDPFWESMHQLNSFEQNSHSSVLSRYDAFNDAFFRGLSGDQNPPVFNRPIQEQYSEQNLHSSSHSRYAAFNDAFYMSQYYDQNAPELSQFQGQHLQQNLHSLGGSSLQASYDSRSIHHQRNNTQAALVVNEGWKAAGFSYGPVTGDPLESHASSHSFSYEGCRSPAEKYNSIIDVSRCQNALQNSSFQGKSVLTQVSAAEPFADQVYSSSSFVSQSQTQVSSCQNLGPSSTTSVSKFKGEAVGTGIANHENPYNASRGLPFYEMDTHVQPFNQIQPITIGHQFQLGEFCVQTGPEIQPTIQPVNVVSETSSTVGATSDSEIPEDEWEKAVFNSSTCSVLYAPYDSWKVDNSRTKPLKNHESMEQSRVPNTSMNRLTQGQVPEEHMSSARPSLYNVDTSTGFISYQTQAASLSKSTRWQNNEVIGRENAEYAIPNEDLSSTMELSFHDEIQIFPPLDQIQPETLDNFKWSSTQLSHASQTNSNIQQTPATRTTFADPDTSSYGVSEGTSSSPDVTSVDSDAIHGPIEECQNRFDGNPATVMTQFKNDFESESPSTATAVTKDNTPVLQERPQRQKFCELCNKSLSSTSSLNEHNMRFHLGVIEKPFKCHICPKTFIAKLGLQRHILHAHTKDKPFKCPKCEYKCKTKLYLRYHLKIHEENRETFKCSICGMEYFRKSDMKRHLKIKHSNLNKKGNTKSSNSQNISNSCGNGEQNHSHLENVDNYKRNSAQLSHARQTDQNIQQAPATSITFADTDTGSYGISEQSSSSPNVTSVHLDATYDPLEDFQNHFDGNSAGVVTQLKNGFQSLPWPPRSQKITQQH